MKKLVILLAVLLSANFMMAQKMDRTNAYNYNTNGQYEKAAESIEKCVEHTGFLGMKPKDQAQAWLYRAMIYLNIYQNRTLYAKYPDALEKAYASLQNCMKADPDYTKDPQNAQDVFSRVAAIGECYFQDGIEQFNNKAYPEAASNFRKSYEISLTGARPDTSALENAGLAYMRGELYDEALTNYTDLKNLGYDKVDLYKNMASCYTLKGDDENSMKVINEGLAKYPGDAGMIIEKVNLYLKQGKGEEALGDLNKLQELDPDNVSILFTLGNIFGDDTHDIFDADKAIAYYKRIIEIDPTYYDAHYNLAMVYITLSNQKITEANEITGTSKAEIERYNALMDESTEFLSQGLPYAQTAYEAQPSDDLKHLLKTMYVKLKMFNEAKALDAE
jgi:tetratricopeptide (TPR) repeat protein